MGKQGTARKKNAGISKSKSSNTHLASNHSNVSAGKISKKPRSHHASKKIQECKKLANVKMDDILEVKASENGGPSKSASCEEAKNSVPQTRGRKAPGGDLTQSEIPSSFEFESCMPNKAAVKSFRALNILLMHATFEEEHHDHEECTKRWTFPGEPTSLGEDYSIKKVDGSDYENDEDDEFPFTPPGFIFP